MLVFLLQNQSAQTINDLERKAEEYAEQILALKRGISVPLPLAVQIHWEGAGDIDLSVVKDGGERVWFPVRERKRSWGELMRDETVGKTIHSELFLSPQPQPGSYDVYVWFFGGGHQRQYTIEGEIVLYPGEPDHHQHKEFKATLPRSPEQKWQRVASYRLTKSGDAFKIEFVD